MGGLGGPRPVPSRCPRPSKLLCKVDAPYYCLHAKFEPSSTFASFRISREPRHTFAFFQIMFAEYPPARRADALQRLSPAYLSEKYLGRRLFNLCATAWKL